MDKFIKSMLETWAFKSQARYGVGGIFEFFDKQKPLDPTKVKGFLFTYFYDSLTVNLLTNVLGWLADISLNFSRY